MKEIKDLSKQDDKEIMKDLSLDKEGLKAIKKKMAKLMPRPERGVETFMRLASKNHYTLNTMVDRKSNILISINAIILSIIIGTVMNQLETDPHLLVPVIMILITNLTSIVQAIIATRPDKVHGGHQYGKQDDTDVNLLFYGNFNELSRDEYVGQMNELINNGDKLYDSIAEDIYYLGKNLNRKFKYLRLSFNTFMIGIVLSVAAFVLCHAFF